MFKATSKKPDPLLLKNPLIQTMVSFASAQLIIQRRHNRPDWHSFVEFVVETELKILQQGWGLLFAEISLMRSAVSDSKLYTETVDKMFAEFLKNKIVPFQTNIETRIRDNLEAVLSLAEQ